MTTLVTGATGFIGSAVARALVSSGHEVRALVRPNSDRANLLGLPIEVMEGDLRDRPSLVKAVDGCRAVFHAGADYRLWARDPETIYETNVAGTEALLAAAEAGGVERFVYTGSVGAMGIDPSGNPADETTPVTIEDLIGHYHRSKFLAEQAVHKFAARGFPAVIVCPTFPLGPRDIKPTPTGRAIRDAAFGRMPAYVDTGINVVHVDDVATGHVLAFQRGRIGQSYILGGDNMTLHDLLMLVARTQGRQARLVRIPHAAVFAMALAAEGFARLTGHAPLVTLDEARLARRHMYFSSARAERELGYKARPADEAVRDAIAWFDSHGGRRRMASETPVTAA